ncbi:MAG: hypothetical protein GX287_04725 [Fusobacteria bacterium]|nr:hypothetical protein [Fusobacteriota bacterium]
MLLNNFFLLLVILTIVFYDVKSMLVMLLIVFFINLYKKNINIKNIKKLKYSIVFIIISFVFQLILNNYGEIFYSFYSINIYYQGIKFGFVTTIKILNLILISWIIDYEKILPNLISKYSKIVKIAINNVPYVFLLFKENKNPKKVFENLIKKIYKEL